MDQRMRFPLPAALLLLSACAQNEPYPAAWTAPVRTEHCADVAGVYRASGERSAPSSEVPAPTLYDRLRSPDDREDGGEDAGKAADRVEIASDGPGALVVRFRDAAGVLEALHYSKLDCRADGVVLETYAGGTRGRSNPVAGFQRETVTLSKAEDGALLVRRRESTTGLIFMFLPIAGSSSYWTRYPPFRGPEP